MIASFKINDVINDITRPDLGLTIFCGAGISINSGLPSAIALLDEILLQLNIEPADKHLLIHTDGTLAMPFELFFETFLENTDNHCILDLFKAGLSSTTHQFITKCYQHHILHEVYTTNFDLLIERAFKRRKLKLDIFRDEVSFNNIKESKSPCKLIKVHGSIDDIDSIRTTLSSIAHKGLSAERDRVIDRLFSNRDSNHKVLIIGYSCSDIFDIIPKVEKIYDPKIRIFLVNHCRDIIDRGKITFENIGSKKDLNPFIRFEGKRINVNTDFFIELLWTNIAPDYFKKKTVRPLWEPFVKDWINKFHGEYLKYTILGQLFYKISDYENALKYHNIALLINTGKRNRGEGASYSNIGLIYHDLKDYDKALAYHRRANRIFKGIDFYYGLAASFTNLGLAYIFKDNKERALLNLKKSLRVSRNFDFKENKNCESDALSNLGLLNEKRNDLKAALDFYFQTLNIDQLGNKLFEAGTLSDIGRVYSSQKDYTNALIYFGLSLDIGIKLGIPSIISYAENHIAEIKKSSVKP